MIGMYLIHKKSILSGILLIGFFFSFIAELRADEGMWLLALLKKQNEEQLKAMGLKIPVEQLNGSADGSLSEAVIAFGSGCTGSVISGSGLVLTNYHCSYDAIQQYVSPSTDIYKNGYWSASLGQELPVKGLSVTINKKILDVTDEVKRTLGTGTLRDAQSAVSKKYQLKYPGYGVMIRPYQNNTLFVLFLQLKYNDVRLVGVPPKIVAKFGGETDNWMWPRQSADFAYFRIYADKSGKPAAFSKANVPMTARNWLHISGDGYKKGDFAMSMGYPGMSDRNAPSFQIREKIQVLNPPMISVRSAVQSIWEDEMSKNAFIKQQYAQKYAGSANYYKNAVGMNSWVDKLNIISRKEDDEKKWMSWSNISLGGMKTEIEEKAPAKRAQVYYVEGFEACEVFRFAMAFGRGFVTFTEDLKKRPSLRNDLAANIKRDFGGFNTEVDKRVSKAVLKLLRDSLPEQLLPDVFSLRGLHSRASIDQYVDELFQTSIFADSAKLLRWLKKPSVSLANDPVLQLVASVEKKRSELSRSSGNSSQFYRTAAAYQNSISEFKAGRYYPDADKTIRLSYGTVSDLQLEGRSVPYQTVFSSLVAKADTVNKDFLLHKKLLELWRKKDFGRYGIDGDMPVDFITNGDVTGGNSGSPMMNGSGQIIGLVFDCNWESMTREFNYEKDLHKVICVDIRYVLWVTEKFSGSTRIVNEINKGNKNLDRNI